ncbi:solute carrier family 25, member 38 [Marchantia polymorpha subsp. ruderalis]|uniref:Solute carrier family 25 member 38 homolog n=2 Tax=Marchantia polymorpha TaxID=3197 RepID=A0AAF6BRQ3_MARPO|nr:hypothetical protein MARPO_0047s0017 [Marchantia polymorpha]BBN14687.1 hypothetical protein Mp_6g13660 [Marchantia polymorpha subsp. ruderalis]|eukprot:PTQ39025.1 hypothetical protein MARPO_0047s0017 [Marchantia polymorpha]
MAALSAAAKLEPGDRAKWRWQKSAGSFMAGSGAGMISTTILQPFEVVKTHMQARDCPGGHSIRGAVRVISERDGVTGFWRGTGAACVRVGLGAGLYFAMLGPVLSTLQTIYTSGQSSGVSMHDKLPVAITMSAGSLTRLLASAMTCPITVVKTRMEYAAASGLNYTGTASALLAIKRTEGISGLYSGMVPTLLRDAPYSGLYLMLYNRIRYSLKDHFDPNNIPHTYINFVSGALAGSSATFFTHPPDVVRTRMQLERSQSTGIVSTVRQIVQVEGVKGLFSGVLPRIGRRGLQQAVSWTIFEEISGWVNHRL